MSSDLVFIGYVVLISLAIGSYFYLLMIDHLYQMRILRLKVNMEVKRELVAEARRKKQEKKEREKAEAEKIAKARRDREMGTVAKGMAS